ncbi:glutamyl-tRNA reductase [Thermodesulfobacteriota bacterium]
MNHETAPLELRECLATEPGNVSRALSFMRDSDSVNEGIFLSTCNRIEMIITTDSGSKAMNSILSMMAELGDLSRDKFIENIYIYEDMAAVDHMFRVGSSLDSMIVGEPQILGQLKDAYRQAIKEKTSGVVINRLMHRAFHAAKRVRSETGISESAVSISYAAVELARKIFYDLKGKKVLLIGAGEMAELAAKHLLRQGVDEISVANRTFDRAFQVAKTLGASPVSFEEIESQLTKVDIVISSTASSEYVVTYQQVKGSFRKRRNKPLFLIDIAVPRDIEPSVNRIGNAYVYDIDDLKGAIEMNVERRQQEAVKAGRIVKEEVVKFEKWLKTLSVVPTIISLREKAERIVTGEMRKSRKVLEHLTPAQSEAVKGLTRSIAEKILSDPIIYLKSRADRAALNTYLDVTRKLFKIDEIDGEGE